jgi:hypothetical protein
MANLSLGGIFHLLAIFPAVSIAISRLSLAVRGSKP